MYFCHYGEMCKYVNALKAQLPNFIRVNFDPSVIEARISWWEQGQYHGWCPGSLHHQVISSHDTDQVG